MSGKSIRDLYPYHVPYRRDSAWYDSGGTWYTLSNWCRDTFHNRWEYCNGSFMFETEQDRTWFNLKWLHNEVNR